MNITNTRRKVIVILREDPSQVAKLRHPFCCVFSDEKRGIWVQGSGDLGPGLPSLVSGAAELRLLVCRQFRGFGVHHA